MELGAAKIEPLKKLINALSNKKCKYGKAIKNRKKLLESLAELDNLVGLEKIKTSIAYQTATLITSKKKCKSMLNTILCGGPGLGKTTVGKIMAKIWLSLGYLDNFGSKTEVRVEKRSGDIAVSDRFLLGLLFVLVLTYVVKAMISLYQTAGYKSALVVGSIIGLIIVLGITYISKRNTQTTETMITTKTDKGEEDHIVIVTRSDFVAGYVGQTAKQTRELLRKNRGKVILIDEAYSLFHGPRDPYGMEALTEIVLYMSEHPTECVFILAGYKNKMLEGILKIQPGLLRRCMWHFECDIYSPQELPKIFGLQANKGGWEVKDHEDCDKVIEENFKSFKNYAGDTERLVFLSSLEPSFKALVNNTKLSKVFTAEDIASGIEKLGDNNMSSE